MWQYRLTTFQSDTGTHAKKLAIFGKVYQDPH